MRNWAQWLVNHNMKWVLYVLTLLFFPLYVLVNIKSFIVSIMQDFVGDIRSIKNQHKTK